MKKPTEFSPWCAPLSGQAMPKTTGIYRFRRDGGIADYIGHTGTGKVTIATRMEVLRASIAAAQMPYRYPYAAAPALWALQRASGRPLEVSWAAIAGDSVERFGRWALEIALHRQEHRASPAANFGRMPLGYRSSSSYSCALIHSGGLYRGGPSSGRDAQHLPGRPPLGPLDQDPHAADWCGATWSRWDASRPASLPTEGIVRARRRGTKWLCGLAQGKLAAAVKRLAGSDVEISVIGTQGWPSHHREEVFTDLLGAHVLHHGRVPG